jgi:ABC-type antimicrobial peptide transport system permease subunit
MYELRVYSSDHLAPQTLKVRKNFSVAKDSLGSFKLAIDGNRYTAKDPIKVSVRGVPQAMISDGAIVGIYKAGARSGSYMTYVNINSRDYDVIFDAPDEAGDYEIRAYTNSNVWKAETLAAQTPLSVRQAPQEAGNEVVAENQDDSFKSNAFPMGDYERIK